MSTVHITSTQLKNQTADILNDVYFHGKDVIVERYGKPVVKLSAVDKKIASVKNQKKHKHPITSVIGILSEEAANEMLSAIHEGKTIKQPSVSL